MTDTNAAQPTLHIEDSGGDGRPVVLIHGWPLSAASWAPQTAALTGAGFRVVAYDRRGFGTSEPGDAYDYDALVADLDRVLTDLDLTDATLVGFSMGGGEVARYCRNHGVDRLRSVVFAAAVPPYLRKTDDNPDGPLTDEQATESEDAIRADRAAFFEQFTTDFFSAGGELKVSEDQRKDAVKVCLQSDEEAVLGSMAAWGTTDFRDDLETVSVPALVLHGDSDAIVPIEGSGDRTHEALADSTKVVLAGAPHGCNVSHADEFNEALLEFLQR